MNYTKLRSLLDHMASWSHFLCSYVILPSISEAWIYSWVGTSYKIDYSIACGNCSRANWNIHVSFMHVFFIWSNIIDVDFFPGRFEVNNWPGNEGKYILSPHCHWNNPIIEIFACQLYLNLLLGLQVFSDNSQTISR